MHRQLDMPLDFQAAERTDGKGKSGAKGRSDAKSKSDAKGTSDGKCKSDGPAATNSIVEPKPVPHTSPPKSQQGQWKIKPTALVSGEGASKQATAKAGADALALMPHIPGVPAPASAEAAVVPACNVNTHNAAAAPEVNKQGPPKGMSRLIFLHTPALNTVYTLLKHSASVEWSCRSCFSLRSPCV